MRLHPPVNSQRIKYLNSDDKCRLCKTEKETWSHLHYQCSKIQRFLKDLNKTYSEFKINTIRDLMLIEPDSYTNNIVKTCALYSINVVIHNIHKTTSFTALNYLNRIFKNTIKKTIVKRN